MEDILAQAKKVAEEAELFTVSSEETQVRFETNRLKHIQSKQSSSVALRIIKDGRIGFALTTRLDNGKDLLNNAVETARFGMLAKFTLPSLLSYPKVDVFDVSVEKVPLDDMVKLGDEMITAITNHTAGILCEAGVSKSVISISVINSRGGQANYTKSIFGMGVEGNLIRGTDMLFVGDGDSSCSPLSDSKAVTGVVIKQLERAKDLASVTSGQLPVILTPNGVASVLIPSLLAGFNGKTVLEGASPIGNKRGKKVFNNKLSLFDDPTLACRPQSRPCDDEGIPSQRTPLIQEGTVANFLYDLQTAALANTTSTGNAGRARDGLPSPSPSSFIIATGDATFDDMVGDIKEGLVIEQVMGAEQGNVLGGDFSGNVLLGYKIENGRLVGRVKNTMITGNVYQVLKDVAAIGSEAKWVDGFLYTPPLYCPSLSVVSK